MKSSDDRQALERVREDIYFQFRAKQYAAIEGKRVGIFHVSDYVNACARNAYYTHLKSGDHVGGITTKTMSVFFAGEAVHRLLDTSGGGSETKLMWNIVDDMPVEEMPTDISEALKVLVGEYDAEYNTVDGPVLVDYKTWLSNGSTWRRRAVDDAHKRQVEYYSYLTWKNHGYQPLYGSVIYMDFSERLEKPDVYTFKIRSVEAIEAELLGRYAEFRSAYENDILPDRTLSWKCDYCPYVDHCTSIGKKGTVAGGTQNLELVV